MARAAERSAKREQKSAEAFHVVMLQRLNEEGDVVDMSECRKGMRDLAIHAYIYHGCVYRPEA